MSLCPLLALALPLGIMTYEAAPLNIISYDMYVMHLPTGSTRVTVAGPLRSVVDIELWGYSGGSLVGRDA